MREELHGSVRIRVQQHLRGRMQQRMLRKLQQLLHQRMLIRMCERVPDLLRLKLQELMHKRMQQHKPYRVDCNMTIAESINNCPKVYMHGALCYFGCKDTK